MLPLPWKTLTAPVPDKEYTALLSYLPLKHYRTIPLFLWLTFKTQQQLHKSKGLIGYSLQAEPLRRRFWTLSAWEDQQSLLLFVNELPHGKIMQRLTPHMDKTQFVQWKVKGSDIPLRWDAESTNAIKRESTAFIPAFHLTSGLTMWSSYLTAHIMPSTPKQRSWLQGEAAPVASGASDFERIVEQLQSSPEQYESSNELRQWVEKNWQQKFVPEWLLKAWGLDLWPLS